MSHGGWYERTPLRERVFLALETPAAPMHFGAVLVFAGGARPPDLDRLRTQLAARLPTSSRLRQRLARVPLLGDPVWVDDDGFDVARHVSRVPLPDPHDDEGLRALAASLFSGALPRDRPLWRLWLVDGLPEDRVALVLKIHHAIANGTSTAGLLAMLLDGSPDVPPEGAAPWRPRAAPGPAVLLGHALARRASLPVALARALPGALSEIRAAVARRGGGVTRSSQAPPAVGLRGATGPDRGLDWLALDLDELRGVGETLGGTLNDVVLAAVTGALARFVPARGGGARGGTVRALVPVVLRAAGAERASLWTVPLPVDEADPRRRFARVRAATAERKRSRPERGLDTLLAVAEVAGASLVALGARLAAAHARFDLLVTNVPGPEEARFLHGARCIAAYPVPPVLPGQRVAIAVASHAGRLFLGLAADRGLVPDLADLTAALREAFDELVRLSRDDAPVVARSG